VANRHLVLSDFIFPRLSISRGRTTTGQDALWPHYGGGADWFYCATPGIAGSRFLPGEIGGRTIFPCRAIAGFIIPKGSVFSNHIRLNAWKSCRPRLRFKNSAPGAANGRMKIVARGAVFWLQRHSPKPVTAGSRDAPQPARFSISYGHEKVGADMAARAIF